MGLRQYVLRAEGWPHTRSARLARNKGHFTEIQTETYRIHKYCRTLTEGSAGGFLKIPNRVQTTAAVRLSTAPRHSGNHCTPKVGPPYLLLCSFLTSENMMSPVVFNSYMSAMNSCLSLLFSQMKA